MSVAILASECCDLRRKRRTRSDEAHLAAQHVDQLGQLVEAGLSEKPADRGDARILVHLEQWSAALFSDSIEASICSASTRIVLNLSSRNVVPSLPTRVCRKNTGRGRPA